MDHHLWHEGHFGQKVGHARNRGPPAMARRPFWANLGQVSSVVQVWSGHGHGQTAGKSNLRHKGPLLVGALGIRDWAGLYCGHTAYDLNSNTII